MTPAAIAQERASQMLAERPECGIAIFTDATSYPGRVVLVAIARPAAVGVLQIPAADYDPLHLMRLAGIDLPPAQPAKPTVEQLRKEHCRAR